MIRKLLNCIAQRSMAEKSSYVATAILDHCYGRGRWDKNMHANVKRVMENAFRKE